ncbi:hypothetical protein [Amycolatopsis silviterrae]|uniref:Secreted protein n=1 Tax=Amycolatopsis silviterrae TaxID=1656914 RepID=A0ABW5H534_9PSEU
MGSTVVANRVRRVRSRVVWFNLVLASLADGRDVAPPVGRGTPRPVGRTWVLRSRGCGLGVGGRMGFRLGLGKGAVFRFRRSRLGLGGRTVPRTRLGSGCPVRTPVGISCLDQSQARSPPDNQAPPGSGCPARNRANNAVPASRIRPS